MSTQGLGLWGSPDTHFGGTCSFFFFFFFFSLSLSFFFCSLARIVVNAGRCPLLSLKLSLPLHGDKTLQRTGEGQPQKLSFLTTFFK